MRKLHFHQSTLKVMDAAKIEWLRYRYREVPLEGPVPVQFKQAGHPVVLLRLLLCCLRLSRFVINN